MRNLQYQKMLATACAVAMLTSCSSSSKSSSSSPTVTMPNVATTPVTPVAPVTPVTPVTPEVSTPTEDATSSATVTVERHEQVINLALVTGSTSMGAARMIRDSANGISANGYNLTNPSTSKEAMTLLSNGSVDIVAMGAAEAADYYSTNQNVSILAVNTMGELYLMEKGDSVQTMGDLAGKTIWATGQGTSYEYIIQEELATVGLTVGTDVTVQFMSIDEVSNKILSGEEGVGLLPVPYSAKVMVEDSTIRPALHFGEDMPMNCLVVQKTFLEDNDEQVSHFMVDYQISLAYMQSGESDLGDLIVNMGVAQNSETAQLAVSQANLTCVSGVAMKTALESYYQMLFDRNPDVIGGGLPYDDFYYGA